MSAVTAFGLLLPDELSLVSWQADRHEVETTVVQTRGDRAVGRDRLVVGADLYEVEHLTNIDVWFALGGDQPTRATVATVEADLERSRLVASVALLGAIEHLLWGRVGTPSNFDQDAVDATPKSTWRRPPSDSAVESFATLASEDFDPRSVGLQLEPLASATRGPDDPLAVRLAPTAPPEGLLRFEVLLTPGPGTTTLVNVSATPTRQFAGRVVTTPSRVRVASPNWAAVAELQSDERGRLAASLQGPGLLSELNLSITLLHAIPEEPSGA